MCVVGRSKAPYPAGWADWAVMLYSSQKLTLVKPFKRQLDGSDGDVDPTSKSRRVLGASMEVGYQKRFHAGLSDWNYEMAAASIYSLLKHPDAKLRAPTRKMNRPDRSKIHRRQC